MISARGLVAPVVLPAAVAVSGADLNTLVVVGPATPVYPHLGVDILLAAGETQQPVTGAPLALATVIAPNPGLVSYVPAGTDRLPNGDPLPSGALARDAWAVAGDVGFLRGLLPVTFPVPALWLLEGIDAATVVPVLDDWLAGRVPGVVPETQVCHETATPQEVGATAEDTYRTRMLAGTWRERLPEAEVLLGLAGTGGGGAGPSLTVRAFDENGAEVPVAAVLEAMATVDPVFMGPHPVVVQAGGLAANLTVRMCLRFDVWDVDHSTPEDAKGGVLALTPLDIRLVADDTGPPIAGVESGWAGPHSVVEVARGEVEGRDFHVEIDLPANTAIRIERDQPRFWPGAGQDPSWSTAGWTAKDTTTPGSWTGFSGIQVGTDTNPVTFWVGTKVRLVLQYEQQRRNQYGKRVGRVVNARRIAPGHRVGLHPGTFSFYDEFTADADGEVSGVSFGVPAGGPLGVAVRRHLTIDDASLGIQGLELDADDQPDHLYEQRHGPGSAATRTYRFLGDDGYFWSQNAREPLFHAPFTSADLTATVKIDANKSDNSKGSTAYAAAFHALKFVRLTHEAVNLLKGGNAGLPEQHDFHLVLESGVSTTGSYQRDPTVPNDPEITQSYSPSSDWFTNPVVIHEYGHAIVRSLSGTVTDPVRRSDYYSALGAFFDRFKAEWGQPKYWHSYAVVTNGGSALSEGLPEIIELFLASGEQLPHGNRTPPAGQETWQRHVFNVITPAPNTRVPLSGWSGRRVEGVFANAIYGYISQATGLDVLFHSSDDTATGYKAPKVYFDAWLASLPPADRPARLAQLHQLVGWLFVDPIENVVGDDFNWTGFWDGRWYPDLYDALVRIAAQDPAGFVALHDDVLVPWNLEQLDPNEPTPPALGPNWTP